MSRVRLVGLAVGVALVGSGCQMTGAPKPLFGGGAEQARAFVAGDRPAALGGNRPPLVNPAHKAPDADAATLPKELNMVTLPPYTVGAPDILLIDAQRLIPLPPYRVEPLDALY